MVRLADSAFPFVHWNATPDPRAGPLRAGPEEDRDGPCPCRRGLQLVSVLCVCTRAAVSRFVVVALAAILFLRVDAAAERRRATSAPFRDFDRIAGIVTSNDEYTIWLLWEADRFRLDYPGGLGAIAGDASARSTLYVAVHVSCRADGRRGGLLGGRPPTAVLSLPMHPGAPDV